MPARKSRHSKQAREGRERYGAKRRVNTRPTLPVVIVVCDDSRTAPAYFDELAREVKSRVHVRVLPAPCHGASPAAVLEAAENQAAAMGGERDAEESNDSVWALIDLEAELDKQREAHGVKRRAENGPVCVVLSNPCFEVWTLAHLVDTGEQFADCAAVLSRLKVAWQVEFGEDLGKKGQADYAKIVPLRGNAVERTKNRNSDNSPSWTEVWRVVEAIDAAGRAR